MNRLAAQQGAQVGGQGEEDEEEDEADVNMNPRQAKRLSTYHRRLTVGLQN